MENYLPHDPQLVVSRQEACELQIMFFSVEEKEPKTRHGTHVPRTPFYSSQDSSMSAALHGKTSGNSMRLPRRLLFFIQEKKHRRLLPWSQVPNIRLAIKNGKQIDINISSTFFTLSDALHCSTVTPPAWSCF
jgi:hypothetical protein